ncbi:MAG: aminoglycoside phosphotransferase family protein [Anaerolineales bacterium]|nr:MAG: aminoglycoside phosphotransferase family protein [Anaerolineales bacterium]
MKEIPTEKIQTIIRKVFPRAEVESYQKLGAGFSYLKYDLCLSDPKVDLTLKVYLRPTEKREPWKETYILKRVAEETGVPVPQVLLFDDSGQFLDRPYAVHTCLPGRTLDAVLPEMAEEDIEMVGYEMGRYLARLHVMSGERYGDYFVEDPLASPHERDYTLARVDSWLKECEDNHLIKPNVVETLRQTFERADFLDQEKPCLVHGDYHEGNVNVEEGAVGYHVTGVFDFEHSQAWSREWDMVKLFGRAFDRYPILQEGFLNGYTESVELSERFWDRLRLYQLAVTIFQVQYGHRIGNADLTKSCQERLSRLLE